MQERAGPVSQWPLSARFAYVLEHAPRYMSHAAAQAFRKLLSPEAIGTMVAVLVVWAASHAVGVGVAIDAVLVAVGFALLMADLKAAELMRKEPDMTWQQITEKYAVLGPIGDVLYRAIIGSAQRSRTSVNHALGVDRSKL